MKYYGSYSTVQKYRQQSQLFVLCFGRSLRSVVQSFTESVMNFCQIVVINDILVHKLLFMLQCALHDEQQQNKNMLLVTLQALQLKRPWNK